MSHKWCGKCATSWWKTSRNAAGKGKDNRSGTDVAKKARAAADKAAQMTDTCEQMGTEKVDVAEVKAKLSTALAGKEAIMIGPHSSDIAERLDQEILTLRRSLTDQRPLCEQLAGVQGVIARGEKRLSLALAEKEKAMEALQAAQDKIAPQRRALEEHQHELDTLQAKIVSASNATANTSFQEDSTGMTPPIRNS